MVNRRLAQDYLKRARLRREALEVLVRAQDYPDVVIAFYGEADFLPLEGYAEEDAKRALNLIDMYFALVDLLGLRA